MISICMIVKNEEKNIEKCLKKIVKYGYEIIVVDTGSKDRTKDIACKFTDNVYDFQWCDDFSGARNYAISKATNNFILTIDCDEFVESFDKDELEKIILENRNKVGRVNIINYIDSNGNENLYRERVSRIFDKNLYKYEGTIHEQLVAAGNEKIEVYSVPINIKHYGYTFEEVSRKDKIKRNIKILKKELAIKGLNPYILYQLGKTYYMNKEYKESVECFDRTLDFDLDTDLEYVQDLIESYGYALINLQQYNEAMKLLNIYDEFSRSSDFIFLTALIYMNNGFIEEAINEFEKAASMNNEKMLGVNSYLSYYNIGVIKECLGEKEEARKYYEKCGEYVPAINRLKLIE